MQDKTHSRRRRSIEFEPAELFAEGEGIARSRRRRATAAFFLAASMKLCINHPHACRHIDYKDRDGAELVIRLADA